MTSPSQSIVRPHIPSLEVLVLSHSSLQGILSLEGLQLATGTNTAEELQQTEQVRGQRMLEWRAASPVV